MTILFGFYLGWSFCSLFRSNGRVIYFQCVKTPSTNMPPTGINSRSDHNYLTRLDSTTSDSIIFTDLLSANLSWFCQWKIIFLCEWIHINIHKAMVFTANHNNTKIMPNAGMTLRKSHNYALVCCYLIQIHKSWHWHDDAISCTPPFVTSTLGQLCSLTMIWSSESFMVLAYAF